MTADRLKRVTGRIVIKLVIARHHPNLAAIFNPHLRASQYMAGRMQTHGDTIDISHFAIADRIDIGVGAQSRFQYSQRESSGPIGCVPRPSKIGMGMGNNSSRNEPLGINIKIPRRAIKSTRGMLQ